MKNPICHSTSTFKHTPDWFTSFPLRFSLINPNQKKAIPKVQGEYQSDSMTQGDTSTEDIFHILNQH